MGKQSERRKTSVAPAAETATRPPIWTEGRQQPRFDLAAYARVATAIARRDVLSTIIAVAGRLATLGTRVSSGNLRVTGRLALSILPSHQRVGATILALERCLVAAKGLIVPPVEPQAPLAYPNLLRPANRPAPAPSRYATAEPTLHAIRTAIAVSANHVAQERPAPTDLRPQATIRNSGWTQTVLAHALLALLMLCAWPVGAIKALLHHLNGGDLHDWS